MSTGISDTTEIELYCHRTESLWVTVWAEIKDGKLTVAGQDLGGTVGAWFDHNKARRDFTVKDMRK